MEYILGFFYEFTFVVRPYQKTKTCFSWDAYVRLMTGETQMKMIELWLEKEGMHLVC